MIDLTIESDDNLIGFSSMMASFPHQLEENLFYAGFTVGHHEINLAKQYLKPKFATGQLSEGLDFDVDRLPGGVSIRLHSDMAYWINVEEGRRAGSKMPPEGALIDWMNIKGIPIAFEFQVRRGIAKRGIPPHPFISRAFQETSSLDGFAQQQFQIAVDKTVEKMWGSS